MPERPPAPDFQTWANDVARRLRDVERRIIRFPDSALPLQTFEDGNPLGDTRFLDFGTGIQATLIGDDYVLVEGAGAGTDSPWDAVCDASLAASEPDRRLFLGIGEALSYLQATVGLTRANVFVRPGTYTEAAGWTNPERVFLFAAPQWMTESSGGSSPSAFWDMAGNGGSDALWTLHGMEIRFDQADAISNPLDHTATFLTCRFRSNGNTSGGYTTGYGVYINCAFDRIATLGNHVFLTNCDATETAGSVTLATASLKAYGLTSNGNNAWVVPVNTIFYGGAGQSRLGGSISTGPDLSCASPSRLVIDGNTMGTISITGTPGKVAIRGTFTRLVVPTCSGACLIDASVDSGTASDITGPCVLKLQLDGAGNVILRGNGISGSIAGATLTGASGTLVDFIAADVCHIAVGADGAGTTGTKKSFNFDANSDKNILDFAGDTTFPVAGIDNGTGNLIRVT